MTIATYRLLPFLKSNQIKSEVHLEPRQVLKMELFAKIVNSINLLSISQNAQSFVFAFVEMKGESSDTDPRTKKIQKWIYVLLPKIIWNSYKYLKDKITVVRNTGMRIGTSNPGHN